jgi:hypothetical protein
MGQRQDRALIQIWKIFMTAIKRFNSGKAGFVLCSSLLGALTGCIYAQPAPRVVYVEPPRVEAAVAVSVEIRAESDFYEPLTPYGRWEVVGTYGRCWIPGRVEVNWRPYCHGHWQRTDAGWYWASEEPWGWATYHYGRWDHSPQFGWYWVPQTQWAPAWVSWHEGGGYVGWAPLHPSARFSAGGSVEVNIALIAPHAFVFVEPRHFLQPVRPSTVVVNNTTIINKTVNITNIKVSNKTVINEGPRTTIIEQASGQKVRPVAVHELRHKEEAPVMARRRATPAESVKQAPGVVRTAVEPGEKKAQAEPQKNSGQQKKAQVEAELRQKEQAPAAVPQRAVAPAISEKASPAPVRNAVEPIERKAQAEAEGRRKDAQNAAQEKSQKAGKELARKTQLESEQRVKDAEQRIQTETPKNPRGLDKQAPAELEPRGKPEVKAEPQRPGKDKKAANKKGAKDAGDKTQGKPDQKPEQKPGEGPSPAKN